LYFPGHDDFVGPFAAVTFRLPFPGGIDADFGAEAEHGRGMVQDVDWTFGEHQVAFGIDVAEGMQRHFVRVVHVDVLVHDDYALGEHHLSEPPDPAHDLTSMPWITFVDRDDGAVVEDAFPGQIHVHHFAHQGLHHGQKDALGSFAQIAIFLGRLADDGG